MPFVLDKKAYVHWFYPPYDRNDLQTIFLFEDSLDGASLTVVLERREINRLNLKANDKVMVRVESSSEEGVNSQISEEFDSFNLRITVKAKITGLSPNFIPRVVRRVGEESWFKNVRIHFITENTSPSRDDLMQVPLELAEKMKPKKDDALTITIAKKYRSP